ncbi:unnamed protein product [Scytosiphon promiscuus]
MPEPRNEPTPAVSFKNVLELIDEVQLYQAQARLLVAGRLLADVDRYIASGEHSDRAEVKEARALLEGELKPSFDELRHRAAECRASFEDWQSPDWLVAQTFMGITTLYKNDPDGSLWIKMHGTMDGVRVMDQLATVREVDLFKKWVPFCDTSTLLKRLGVVELLAYFSVSMPGVGRDCVLHAYGCDSVLETGCILIQGRSVEQVPEGVEVPAIKGWRRGRMDVRAFKAKIEVLSPTSARTSVVANIDPKAPVPQAVVNFVVRKVAGMFLYYLKQTAECIGTDESNCHRQRILSDEAFYKSWLFPRFERFYRQQGWSVESTTAADGTSNELTDEQSCSSSKSKSTSNRSPTSFRPRSGPRLKHVLKRLKLKRRRKDQKSCETVSVPHPPVSICSSSKVDLCRDLLPLDIVNRRSWTLCAIDVSTQFYLLGPLDSCNQVEPLGVDARLVKKWQVKRDSRRNGTPSARLLGSVVYAVCAALIRWVMTSDEVAAARARWFLLVLGVILVAYTFGS